MVNQHGATIQIQPDETHVQITNVLDRNARGALEW